MTAKRPGSEEELTSEYIRNNRWLHFDERYKACCDFSLKFHHLYILRHLLSDYVPFQSKFNKSKYLSMEQECKNIVKSEVDAII